MMPTRTWMVATLAGTLLLLAGCGGPDNSTDGAEPTAEPTTAPTAEPTSPAPSAPSPSAPAASTPSTAAPSTTAPPAAVPAGELISYETDDEDGVTILTASDTGKLRGAPTDFKAFIAAELKRSAEPDPGCTEPAQIYVSRVDTGGWARGGYFIPQCGGYATLWARSNGAWKQVWGGQSLVECSTLTRYEIPARIAGDQCLKGEDAVPYRG